VIAVQTGHAPARGQPFEGNIGNFGYCYQIRRARQSSMRPFPLYRCAGTDADLARQLCPAQTQRFTRTLNAFPQRWGRMMASSDSSFHTKELLMPVRMTAILAQHSTPDITATESHRGLLVVFLESGRL
jgi:hypothetical protein